MVFDQFVDTCVEAIEWQSVTRQHQYVLRNLVPHPLKRPQVDAERVQVWFHGMHAHIG